MGLRWTDEEIEFIRQHASEMPCYELLKLLNAEFGNNRNLTSLYNLKSSKKIRSPNINTFRKGMRNSPKSEFKIGHTPWNKGIHYSLKKKPNRPKEENGPKNSIKNYTLNTFKEGHIPHNHRPIGSERLAYGRVMIKIGEPRTWELLSTLIWQSVHKRALPKNMVVVFANKDITDYSPENLVAVTKAQLMVINHMGLHTYDAESLQAAITLADLRMQKNKRKRGG